jgi:pimeloyl-ACP methyl ester carboxylesterase
MPTQPDEFLHLVPIDEKGTTMKQTIITGSVVKRTLQGDPPLDYFAYIPLQGQRHGRVFVSVHGISRNAEQHLIGFSPQAERHGTVMLAPFFPEKDFPYYQRLGTSALEARADLAFDRVLADASVWLDIVPLPLRIFGFSGGGQFLHRYALFHPRRIAGMVLAAPGWYTFPDPEQRYPLGLRSSSAWPKLRFSLARYLRINTLVMVGEEDDIRQDDLNKSRRIDSAQGLTRIERAERWVSAMRAMARAFHVPPGIRFELVPNANHAFESYLSHPPFAEDVFEFLFGDSPEQMTTAPT